MNPDHDPVPEKPRHEPEIIPPIRERERSRRGASRIWISMSTNDGDRVYVAKSSLFVNVVLALLAIVLSAAVIIILFGLFLIALPVAGVLIALALIGFFYRRMTLR
jgi:hypothetical protein